MSELNEVAQWAVLLFLSIFVLGLTRQLGNFLTAGREQRATVEGPEKGREIPRALVIPEERRRLAELMHGRAVEWFGIIVMDERCVGCDEMLAHLESEGVPELAPLLVVLHGSSDEHFARVRRVADVAVVDPGRLKRTDLTTTPFCMVVDREFRLAEKAIGLPLETLLHHWRGHRESSPPPALAHAGRNGRSGDDTSS